MLRISLLCAAALLGLAGPVAAQEWPNRPVRIIVPFAPGGATDHIARGYADKLSQAFKQSFVIENRGGAGGAIGIEATAKAAPDGYTLAQASVATLAITPQIRKNPPYDPFRDLAFVGRVTDSVYAMGVNLNVPVNTLQEFIAYAKANPGKINFGSAGLATSAQFAGVMLNHAAGIEMTHVPYRGSADALNDLLAGNVQVQYEGVLFPLYRSGKIKVLGVTTPQRHPQFPEIPAIKEIVPNYDFTAWSSWVAPAGTPKPIIDKLSAALNKAADDPDLQERLLTIGFTTRHDTPEAMARDLRASMSGYAKLIQELNLAEK